MPSTMADDDRSQEKKNGGASGIDRRHSERQEHRVPSLATSKKQGSTVAKGHAALYTETPEAIPKTIGTSDAEAKSAETVNAEIDGAQSIKSYMSPQRFFPLERSYSEMSIERMDSGQFEKYEQTNEEKEKGFNESASGGLVTTKNDINDEDEDDDDDDEDVDDQDKRSFVEDKVRYMFGLPSNERIQAEFPCYLVRLVTLPGWMYVTDSSVCFFASLPEKEKGPQKTGYLSKKNHRASPRSYRYYFELRNHVLSWYESAEEKYAPLDSIDLKQVIDIRASRTRRNGFQITTSHSKWNLTADSEVSQKEWLDELRRSAFMARNAGNSVRIVLPFNKMAQVNKAVAFSFAEYLRIRIADASEFDGQDEYYFAFFPDIDAAYHKIATMHCEGQSHSDYRERSDTLKSSEDGSVDVSAFESSDNVFGNTSSGVSAMLVGAITHPKATFWDGSKRERQRQTPTITTEAMNDAPHAKSPASSIVPSDSISDRHNDTLTAPSDEKSKRHSWSFGWLLQQQQSIKSVPTSPVSTPSINTNQSEHLLSVAADQTKEAPKKMGRFRSSSTASIKQLARQSLGLSAAQTSKEQPPNEPSIDDSSLDDEKKSKHDRTGSLSGIIKQARKQVSSSGPSEDHQDTKASELPPLPKPAKQVSTSWWISKTLHDSLLQQGNLKGDDVSATADDKQDLKRQKSLNDELRKYFPMLGDAENVIALFPSSLWRTLPYPGRVYFTDNYICFHSKVLAGRQRLIIPLGDITSVRRLKSRGYYLLHGIGLVAKDLQEEIYFEFSAVTARDRCYALFYLLTGDYGSPEKRKEVDAASVSVGLSNILASSTEHVLPPMEYEGPPLLSSIPTVEPATQTTAPKSLHITCLTIGSRGDVQPYIALCKQLQKEGHRCRIASHGEYQKWVEEHGIEFRSIGGDPGELMKLCIDNGFLSYSFIKDGMKFFYTWFEALLKTAWEACQGTDVLIESPSAMVGIHMAEKLEIPYFRSMPFPWTRTTRFSHPFATQNYTRGRLLYNDMTYVMIDTALWTGTSKYINRFRRQTLQLPATSVERLELWRVPYIYSFSPTVLPPPKDWPDYVHVTGYWFLDNPHMNWKPDDSFVKFLEAKDERPIIYIGFGSIIVPDPEAMSAVIIEAVQQAGVRAIICKGWSSRMKGDSATDVESSKMLNRYPGTIYSLDAVPHDWLFPRIHGVVHHGGAGTTAAGLRAGLPTIIKPFFGDQRFWGQRVEELGVGVCISKLTVAKLAEALKTISRNNAIISKAHALGEAIRKENGVKTAVDCIYRDLNYARRTRQKVSESEGGSKMSLLPTNWWGTAGQSTGDNISESDDVANSTEIKAH